jgi:hypothetical protein
MTVGDMSERRDAIVRLLRTRDDHLPLPVHRTEASSGFVHQTVAPAVCPTCDGVSSFGCTGCGGRGEIEVQRDRDPYATDKVLPYGFSVDRHEAARERDRQIDVLDRQLARPVSVEDELADANAHPWAWELARRRMWRQFDYAPLDRALEQLRNEDEPACRALHAVYVYGWLAESSAPASALERGLDFLDARLPDPIRAPGAEPGQRVRGKLPSGGGAAAKAKDARAAEMRELARAGAAPAELAAEFGVSIRTVYRVVNEAA